MALCSLSTGSRGSLFSFARAVTRFPAQTRVSLLARASFFPASRARRAGKSPTAPDMAASTVSASSIEAASRSPPMPESTFVSVSARRILSSAAAASS